MEQRAPVRRSSWIRALCVLCVVSGMLAALTGCGRVDQADKDKGQSDLAKKSGDVVLTPESVNPAAVKKAERSAAKTKARIVQLEGAGAKKTYGSGDYVSPGAPTDAQVKTDLKQARAQLVKFKKYLSTSDAYLQTGPRAKVLKDGTAVAPESAPDVIKRVIQAGNAISKLPYKWGGGHGSWRDNGYDCSGSVSFALAGAGFLKAPLTSGLFARWGAPGPGKWITIYANGGHVFMFVAGLRFDTSGETAGTRWQDGSRSVAGFSVRHIPGL